jgi:hypothetical protein
MARKKEEKLDQLNEALKLGDVHCERMNFAFEKIKHYFPLKKEIYLRMCPEYMSFFDQLIFRFSKLQDSMGHKLFPAILENLEEDTRGVSFIDILGKLEELNYLKDKNIWLQLRETRNIVTHEYPFVTEQVIEGLNLLYEQTQVLAIVFNEIKKKILEMTEKTKN